VAETTAVEGFPFFVKRAAFTIIFHTLSVRGAAKSAGVSGEPFNLVGQGITIDVES